MFNKGHDVSREQVLAKLMGVRPVGTLLLALAAAVTCLAQRAECDQYMEVRPYVLTTRMFRLCIPAPQPNPKVLHLKVSIKSLENGNTRNAPAIAEWKDMMWPKEIWEMAGMSKNQETRGAWVAEVPIESTRPGIYVFSAEVMEPESMNGKRFRSSEVELYHEPEWLQARAGMEGLATLLKPWSPVKVVSETGKRRAIRSWNRVTVLSVKDGLVDEITSGQERILASPIRLLIRDGKGTPLQPTENWRIVRKNSTSVVAEREFRNAHTLVTVSLEQEYDGLTWIKIDWDNRVGISSLDFEFALRPEVAKYIYYFPDYPWFFGNLNNVIRVPRAGYGWTSRMPEWLFLGSQSSGLYWHNGYGDGWHDPDDPDTIEVFSRGAEVELRVHVLKGMRPIKRGSYEFAFQATPVKPWPDEPLHNRVSTWWPNPSEALQHIDGIQEAGYKVIQLGEAWTTGWGGVVPADPTGLMNLTAEAHRRGMRVIVYFGFEIDESIDAFQKYPWEIISGPTAHPWDICTDDPRLPGVGRPNNFFSPERLVYFDPRNEVEIERLLDGMKTLLTKYKVDGFYLDGTQLPTLSLRLSRNFMKRMRYLVDRYGGGIIYAHTSSRNDIAVNAFADVIYDGEQLKEIPDVPEHDYRKVAESFQRTKDYLFLILSAYPWGVPHDSVTDGQAYADLCYLLGTGVDAYLGGSTSLAYPRKAWLDGDLWHASYTGPEIATPRWKDRPDQNLYVSYYKGNNGLYTVVVYNAATRDLSVEVPIRSILQLAPDQVLGNPTVLYSASGTEWDMSGEAWKGSVASARAVIAQCRLLN